MALFGLIIGFIFYSATAYFVRRRLRSSRWAAASSP